MHFSVSVAASVAVEVVAIFVLGVSGDRFIRADEVKGRSRRAKKLGAEEAMSMMRRGRRRKKRRRCERRRGRVGDWILTNFDQEI